MGPSANLCKDCRKYICQKCSINVTNPSKENNENNASTSSRSIHVFIKVAQKQISIQRLIPPTMRKTNFFAEFAQKPERYSRKVALGSSKACQAIFYQKKGT